jgi:hypothetical protein
VAMTNTPKNEERKIKFDEPAEKKEDPRTP